MAMQTMREGLPSAPQISWWNAFGSQPLTPESLSGDSDSFAGAKVRSAGGIEQGVNKQSNSASHFAFSLGKSYFPLSFLYGCVQMDVVVNFMWNTGRTCLTSYL